MGDFIGIFNRIKSYLGVGQIVSEDKLVYDAEKPITSDRQIPDYGQVTALIEALADAGLFLRIDGGNMMLSKLKMNGNFIENTPYIRPLSEFTIYDTSDLAAFLIGSGYRYLLDSTGNSATPLVDYSNNGGTTGFAINTQAIAGRYGRLLFALLNANRDYQFPDESGIVALISQIAYGSGWSGDTKKAPSADVLYNKLQSMDAAIAAGATVATVFDASTASTFPSGGSATSKYRVVNSGTNPAIVQGVSLETNDVFYPKVASPGPVAADWYVVQANGDYIVKTLLAGKILVGSSGDVATPQTPGGAVAMDNAGVFSLIASYVYGAIVSGVATVAGVIADGDSILTMLNKLQSQITAAATRLDPVTPGVDYKTYVETVYNDVKSWVIRAFYPDFELAKQFRGAINVFYKKIVTLSAGNPNLHGSVIVDDYVYWGVRPTSQTVAGRIVKMRLDNVSSYTVTTLGSDQVACESLVYVPEKGKIYVAHHGNSANGHANALYITEYDPITEAQIIAIADLSVGYRMYYPACCSDGQFLYVSSGYQTVGATLKVRKYNLTTYAFVSELDTGLIGGGHSLKYDGFGSLYLTTTYRTVAIQQYLVKIDVASFTMSGNIMITGESITDDMAIIGDSVYLGMEYIFTSTSTLTVARVKTDLSGVDYFTFPAITAMCYGCIYANGYLWILADHNPGNIIRVNPETLQADIYTCPAGEESPNELLFDGKNFYVAYWKNPAVVAMYNKFQFQETGRMVYNGSVYVYTAAATTSDVSTALLSKMNALVPTAVRTANFTLNANDLAPVDTTSGNLVGTMPNDPADKSLVAIKHITQGGTNTITLNTVSPAVFNKAGGSTSGTIRLQSECWLAQYDKSNKIWYVIATDAPLAQLDARYLQLAGGQTMAGLFNLFGDAISAMQPVTLQQLQSYVVGLWDDRGNYNASGNVFPSSGGSGTAGAILKGDIWTISVAGALGGVAVNQGDTVRALVDTPGTTAGNWAIAEGNLGYTPENQANKATDFTTLNHTLYPSVQAVDNRVKTNEVLTAKVSLTSAQILALNTTPVQLVASPGPGKYVKIIDILCQMNFSTAAYSTNTALNFRHVGSGLPWATNSFTLNSSNNRGVQVIPITASGANGQQVTDNTAFEVTVNNGNPTGGSGTMDVYVTYKIITK